MQIKSNKRLLAKISKHEVGIKYPDLIPHIAFNILIQRDNSIFSRACYSCFSNWFYWAKTKEGHDYWRGINKTLHTVNTEND